MIYILLRQEVFINEIVILTNKHRLNELVEQIYTK